MAIRTELTEAIAEKTSAKITAVVQDEDGNGISSGSLDTLTLTLYQKDTDNYINSRNKQNVLNANGVTVDASGNLAWEMSPEDTQIVGSGNGEIHVALFEWTWSGGAKAGRHLIEHKVVNVDKVS